ncbi:hypothetical protein G6F43_007451 [Rhizopus delemar]|nr:hypothetical protein G6F43_007451 [Rhizopus delemar]
MKVILSFIFLFFIIKQLVNCNDISPTVTTREVVTTIITVDENNNKKYSDQNDKKHSVVVATETVYTTVIETPSPVVIHNVSDSGSDAPLQQQPLTTTSSNTTEQLKNETNQDQSAIKRMIMILSLVGGLGVIAIVATAVIFTRIKAKNKRKREEAAEAVMTADDPSSSSNNSDNRLYPHPDSEEEEVVPSAPPALMAIDAVPRRRHVISMISQTTACPSAPTAKELDAVVDDEEAGSCSRYVMPQPEGPPPAYTPSAPPHYAIDTEVSRNVMPRRHSLGP